MSDTVTIRGRAPGEADFFCTLERVLGGLLAALKAGRIDEAVDVHTRCREDNDALALRICRAFNRVLAARLRETTARLSRGAP